ncbi:bifunctional adenosylcobinamide kinase/adenosylcobinamide-phosphate guanylyltransferase [Bacillus massilinigeriensis]|uniref:bifunctional adenosylcobinamide kinase/adenosylcobinamide-phosphate guanylyltransferase n=1 Tax=Bacillus massilionigeriensis TaxID=1805475 RepID=UPI001F1E65EC|nr:bifunctional adenosylcobinamide kinase/adenosylcobinamide-phosphate guanylyltransferase [Bacillus massilionigeriensis]
MFIRENVLVYEGIEEWIKNLTEQYNVQECREKWLDFLKDCQIWEESSPNRKVVCIGVDITKGVVPMEKSDRQWRDITGWCYQDLVRVADRVDLIWYGINQRIK